ncbi:MAG: alpha-galactosidase [Clostridiales bacterium]|nr:alpha-galactosidase [Clostridiales bacterium]
MILSDYRLHVEYELNGITYSADKENDVFSLIAHEVGESALKLSIKTNQKVLLKKVAFKYNYNFSDDEKIYVNGYQSWTKSREYTKKDKQYGLRSVSKYGIVREYAAPSGDYDFARYGGKGFFHAITYGYIRKGYELLLLGSLSDRMGYTVIYFDTRRNEISIEKDVEGLSVEGEYLLIDFRTFKGGYDEVFDAYFAAMGIKKPRIDHLAGYTSWYNYFQSIDEKIINRDLDGLLTVKDKGVNIFQIDDGYAKHVGDWLTLDEKKFPNGLKPIVDRVHENGLLAGLWMAPFSADFKANIVKEHPDWFLKNEKGKKIIGGLAWGGFWVLDHEIPEVREYIGKCFRKVFDEYGFDMVKLDFLYSACIIPRNNKTRGQLMYEAMDFLRECCGDKLILGCGVPIAPAMGVVDACRISCDVELSFKDKFYTKCTNQEIISTKNAMNNSIFRRHLNHRAWINDPDVFFLRDDGMRPAKYNWEQKLLLAKINNMFGNVLFVSDNIGAYDDNKRQVLIDSYKPFDGKVKMCEYVDAKHIKIEFEKGGKDFTLVYNTCTGQFSIN